MKSASLRFSPCFGIKVSLLSEKNFSLMNTTKQVDAKCIHRVDMKIAIKTRSMNIKITKAFYVFPVRLLLESNMNIFRKKFNSGLNKSNIFLARLSC